MGQIGFTSGFVFPSSYGNSDNFELYFPMPGGGFARLTNSNPAGWATPAPLAGTTSKRFLSLAVCEGDYREADGKHARQEMLAITADGMEFWSRDAPDDAPWKYEANPLSGSGYVGLAYGRTHDPAHAHETLFAFGSKPDRGIAMAYRDPFTFAWSPQVDMTYLPNGHSSFESIEYPLENPYEGLAWALGTVGDPRDFADSSDAVGILVAVRKDQTALVCHEQVAGVDVSEELAFRRWTEEVLIDLGVRGRPAVIQSDRGSLDIPFTPHLTGRYELVAPAIVGGLFYYTRNNNIDGAPWHRDFAFGSEIYDEVSMFQSKEKGQGQDTADLNVFAWKSGETWVHWFIQHNVDGAFQWVGPITLGYRPTPAPELWEVTCCAAGRGHAGREWVSAIGGVRDGQPWTMTKEQAMGEIQSGRKIFETVGADGSRARVLVVTELDPNAGVFHPYLTTTSDGNPDDNLLKLPGCPS